MISAETRAVLQQYLAGNVSNRDLSLWLAQAEYDFELPNSERDTLAQIRLIVIEEAEGLRDPEDIVRVVSELLASESPNQVVIIVRTGSATAREASTTVTGVASPVRYAGI